VLGSVPTRSCRWSVPAEWARCIAPRDTRLNRDIALKVLLEREAADPQRRARFAREAQNVAALNHPNIVTIFSVEEADGIAFLTMEFVAAARCGN
jgi:serine/threonine protein kinase